MPAESIQQQLARRVRGFYQRGWVLGTSGNFSAVLAPQPLRLAITASGVDKGQLDESQILEVNDRAAVLSGNGKPSAETLLHLAIIAARGAGSVLHT
ncbi:MAG: class II aldolase/adducin family protein, partial [Candidatus Acidiferrales bacterium]